MELKEFKAILKKNKISMHMFADLEYDPDNGDEVNETMPEVNDNKTTWWN